MPLNITIWKINNFFLILYSEISVLIGPIPRLFVTGALFMVCVHCYLNTKVVYNSLLIVGLGIMKRNYSGPSFHYIKSNIGRFACQENRWLKELGSFLYHIVQSLTARSIRLNHIIYTTKRIG